MSGSRLVSAGVIKRGNSKASAKESHIEDTDGEDGDADVVERKAVRGRSQQGG